MKTISNLTKEHKQALVFAIENTEGAKIHDLRQIDKICTVIEQTGEAPAVELEDADFSYLYSKFTALKGWNASRETRKVVTETAERLEAARGKSTDD